MTALRTISDAQYETDLMQVESLVFAVNDEAGEFQPLHFARTLLHVMRRPGTRDALIVLLAGMTAQQKQEFAVYMVLLGMDRDVALTEATMEVQDNWHTTLAALLYMLGFDQEALDVLNEHVLDRQHRMAGLLRRALVSELPAATWAGAMQKLTVEECIRFVRLPASV